MNGANLGEHVNDTQQGVHVHEDDQIKLDNISSLLDGEEHHEGCMLIIIIISFF